MEDHSRPLPAGPQVAVPLGTPEKGLCASYAPDVDALRWTGPRAEFAAWPQRLGTPPLHERASMLAAARVAVVR